MSVKNLKPIKFIKNIMIGCDPEFFFVDRNGKVVGSEKILTAADKNNSQIVIDGVQAEINPSPSYCRELLAVNIASCFRTLNATLQQRGKGNFTVKCDSLVDVTREELNSLSEGCQVFGCMPSTNIYNEGKDKTSEIKVDPKKYLKRSAGGHIHLGNSFEHYLDPINDGACERDPRIAQYREIGKRINKALKDMPDVMVAVLDIVVGNTCVLLDRSAGNAERRENYGRAGEYRIKPYGIEYRTLSNFWLRSYPLFAFVTGMCRFAVHIVSESTEDNDYVKALYDAVERKDIVRAINTNDRTLALTNFKKIQEIFKQIADEQTGAEFYPIRQANLKFFYHFILRIKQRGLEYWFPEDALTHWCGHYNNRGGWERFSRETIYNDLCSYEIDLNKKKKLATSMAY